MTTPHKRGLTYPLWYLHLSRSSELKVMTRRVILLLHLLQNSVFKTPAHRELKHRLSPAPSHSVLCPHLLASRHFGMLPLPTQRPLVGFSPGQSKAHLPERAACLHTGCTLRFVTKFKLALRHSHFLLSAQATWANSNEHPVTGCSLCRGIGSFANRQRLGFDYKQSKL